MDPSRSSQPRASDEVGPLRLRAGDVHGEVDQEDDADDVVVHEQQIVFGVGHRQEQQDHDRQREDRQDEDEDVVRVAVLAEHRCLCRGHARWTSRLSDHASLS